MSTSRLSRVLICAILGWALLPLQALAQAKFDGLYLGGHLGYARGKDSGQEYDTGVRTTFTQRARPDGTTYGMFAGYNWVRPNNLLLGVEADVGGGSQSDSTLQLDSGVPDPTYPTTTKIRAKASLLGRVGVLLNEQRSLAYITGGYSAAHIETTFRDVSVPASQTGTTWKGGWALGAGFEHGVTNDLSLRFAYRYADYGHRTVSTSVVFGAGLSERQSYTDQEVTLGLVYRFGTR